MHLHSVGWWHINLSCPCEHKTEPPCNSVAFPLNAAEQYSVLHAYARPHNVKQCRPTATLGCKPFMF